MAMAPSLPALLLNVGLFQLGWFSCVLGAANGMAWLGPAVALGVAGFYLIDNPGRGREARMLLAIVLLGTALDTVLVAAGFVVFYQSTWPAPLAPAWMSALWLVFGTTLTRSLAWVQQHPIWGMLLGAVGGPLAYAGGAALGAAEFTEPSAAGLTAVMLTWAAAMLALAEFGAWAMPPPASAAARRASTVTVR
jgi:hypothetical protein